MKTRKRIPPRRISLLLTVARYFDNLDRYVLSKGTSRETTHRTLDWYLFERSTKTHTHSHGDSAPLVDTNTRSIFTEPRSSTIDYFGSFIHLTGMVSLKNGSAIDIVNHNTSTQLYMQQFTLLNGFLAGSDSLSLPFHVSFTFWGNIQPRCSCPS